MNDTITIMEAVIGSPSNDLEGLVLYMSAAVVGVLIIYFVLSIFKILSGLIK